jgi:Family of unknown function (DUF6165)
MLTQARISVGEYIDKITILEIKLDRIKDAGKLENVGREYSVLTQAYPERLDGDPEIQRLRAELKAVNEALWRIEDDLRAHERQKAFDARFIELARSVYFTNDRRAELKKRIDLALGSELTEEKSYGAY